jgi:hypothetical protein
VNFTLPLPLMTAVGAYLTGTTLLLPAGRVALQVLPDVGRENPAPVMLVLKERLAEPTLLTVT